MTAFCTRCGATLDAGSHRCTDRRWWWWLLALVLFFALGFWLALKLAPKCPSCDSPAGGGAGAGRGGQSAGTSGLDKGPPQKLGNGAGQGPAEAAGGSSNGQIEGSGKLVPHEFGGKLDTGTSTSHPSQDGEPRLDQPPVSVAGDKEFYGAVSQLAQGVAPYGAVVGESPNGPGARTHSLLAYDFTYDKTTLPRYPDNVRNVASSISYALDSKTGEHTGAFGTGAGISTNSSFDDVVAWYSKNLPAGWQSSSIGDFGKATQQAIQGPGGDLMKLMKGEMPGAPSTDGAASPAAPKVRVALFKPPSTAAASPDSTVMVLQKDDRPVTIYLQTQVK